MRQRPIDQRPSQATRGPLFGNLGNFGNVGSFYAAASLLTLFGRANVIGNIASISASLMSGLLVLRPILGRIKLVTKPHASVGGLPEDEMRSRSWFVIVAFSAAIAVGALYLTYHLIDPLPPRHFAIAAAGVGSVYENSAKQYQQILARYGVRLEIRNSASALEDYQLLRDPASGVQAALTTFGITKADDPDSLYSLGGTFNTPIFILYRNKEPLTVFAQFRGKRLAIGMPGTALRLSMLEVLKITGGWDPSNVLFDLDYAGAVEALIAGRVDVAVVSEPNMRYLERLLGTGDIRLMNATQAEAIARTIPGLKHVVLWRGLVDLSRDIPNSNIDLLAFQSRLLVRKDLHPALQYLLLGAMRELHRAAGPFNTLGEFPAERPNDLPLSPTAQAFYRSGPTLWQRYTSFWLSSLLNRIAFFVIPVFLTFIPIVGFLLSFHRWIYVRRIIVSKRDLPRDKGSGTVACAGRGSEQFQQEVGNSLGGGP
jgi:uncharacterized protein